MRSVLLLLFTTGLFGCNSGLADRIDPDSRLPLDEKIVAATLDNGARFIIRRHDQPTGIAELRLLVEAGSVHEDDDQLGAAHFVEHMAFRGTRNFAHQQLVQMVESFGVAFGPDLNAEVSPDVTSYRLRIPTRDPEVLRQAFQIFEDWGQGMLIDEPAVDSERGVLSDEFRLRRDVEILDLETLLEGSPYGERPPRGTLASIRQITPLALQRFYRDWYRPDRMTVIAVGDFDVTQVEALVREHMGRWRMPPEPRRFDPRTASGPLSGDRLEVLGAPARRSWLTLLEPRPWRPRTVGEYRQSLLTHVCRRLLASRIQFPDAIPSGVGSGDLLRGYEDLTFSVHHSSPAILSGLLVETQRTRSHEWTRREVRRAGKSVLDEFRRRLDSLDHSEALADAYLRHLSSRDPRPVGELQLQLAEDLIADFSRREVDQRITRWLESGQLRIALGSNLSEQVSAPEMERRALEILRQPPPPAPPENEPGPEFEAPDRLAKIVREERIEELGVDIWHLENGARVVLKPLPTAPGLRLSGFGPGGKSILAPEDLPSAAILSTEVGGISMGSGAQLLISWVGDFRQGVDWWAGHDALEVGLRGVYVWLTQSDIVGAIHDRTVKSLIDRWPKRQLQALSGVSQWQLYGDTPLFEPTDWAIHKSQAKIAERIYSERFAAAGAFTFVIAGDFEPEDVRKPVRRYLGNLPNHGRQESWRDPGARPIPGYQEFVIPAMEGDRASIHFHFWGPRVWSPETAVDLEALIRALKIRFHRVLREEKGLTYHVSVGGRLMTEPWEHFRLEIALGTAAGKSEEVRLALIQCLDDAEELSKLASTVKTQMLQTLSDQEYSEKAWADLLSDHLARGADPRLILDRPAHIRQLDRERLRRAAESFLDFERALIGFIDPERQVVETTESGG